jgi:3-oxoacyl-[acyl-carrier protein] reductase
MTGTRSPLEGKVAIVTGATAGIGHPTCLGLGLSGVRVVAVGRDPSRVAGVAREIERETGGTAIGIAADVRRESDVSRMAETALERFGRIDILVASAGILRPSGAHTLQSLARMSVADWDEVLDTNLRGVFLSNRAVLPAMIRQREGHIINLSSTSGRKGYAFDAAYCASKFAVIGLTESVAEEVRGYGVKVEAILPGAIDTGMWEQNGPFRRPDYALAPERVAEYILTSLSMARDTHLTHVAIEATAKPGTNAFTVTGVLAGAPRTTGDDDGAERRDTLPNPPGLERRTASGSEENGVSR